VTTTFLCRTPPWRSVKALPSAQKSLGKGAFAERFFVGSPLPSVALGKAFAERKLTFAEHLRHSANPWSAVVHGTYD